MHTGSDCTPDRVFAAAKLLIILARFLLLSACRDMKCIKISDIIAAASDSALVCRGECALQRQKQPFGKTNTVTDHPPYGCAHV